jgi:formylglycine-generating enzyme required for sulfatase activity
MLAVFPFIVVLLAAIASAPALADKRVALVIGNSAYQSITPLDNPKNDARLMADTLRSLGFSLVGGRAQLDLDKGGIDRAVRAFGAQLQGADVGLFYYAGHGVQVSGANYLVPVDANPVRQSDVDFQMLDANVILRQMADSGTKLNLVILDACRNNPFGGRGLRGGTRGLAQMQAPEGTLISFATQPGNVAQDGDDGDSPYTKALAQTIRKPGLDVFRTFNEVGLAVASATGGTQQPWVSLSPIKGDFYFVGAPEASVVPVVATPGPSEAERAWAMIKDATSVTVLDDFIRRFGDSFYATLARARLEELKKAQVATVTPPAPPPSAQTPCGGETVSVSLASRPPCPLSTTEERGLRPKDVFQECATCPEMVVVPAGSFTMGSRTVLEYPQHQVTIAAQFAVGKFELTFEEWDRCIAASGCNGYKPSDTGWGRGRRPVINVSWEDANAYVAWLAKLTGKPYRLLSDAEYEYAARAGTTTAYPWGNAIGTKNANCHGCGSQWDNKQTAPVGSFAANGFGLYDMVGNVWEWTEDCFHYTYNGAPADGSAWTSGDCSERVWRGGSWHDSPQEVRSASRNRFSAANRNGDFGFRVGRTLLTP